MAHRKKVFNNISRIVAYGSSLYIHIPPYFVERLGWKAGDRLAVEMSGEVFVTSKIPLEYLLHGARIAARQAAKAVKALHEEG